MSELVSFIALIGTIIGLIFGFQKDGQIRRLVSSLESYHKKETERLDDLIGFLKEQAQ